MSTAAWMLLTALVIGAINVATRFVGDHMELLGLRLQQSREERGLQIAWLRQHNEERYGRVKDWVIDVMKMVDPSPVAWRTAEVVASTEGTQPSRLEAFQKVGAQAAEVKLLASSDERLAQKLGAFIDAVGLLAHGPDAEQVQEAHSAGAAVVNKVYGLMIQLPTDLRPRERWWRRLRR